MGSPRNRVSVTCSICGKVVERKASAARAASVSFCSIGCRNSPVGARLAYPQTFPNPQPGSKKIYSLSDPRDGRVRYVGATTNTCARMLHHIFHSSTPDRYAPGHWLLELRKSGLRPVLTILQIIGDDESWEEAEQKHIAHFRELFPDLLNRALGGKGSAGFCPTEEARAKMSAARKGVRCSIETRAKMSESAKRWRNADKSL